MSHMIRFVSTPVDGGVRHAVHKLGPRDAGILAMTLALSPRANYTGGGTFFEHLGEGCAPPMERNSLPSLLGACAAAP